MIIYNSQRRKRNNELNDTRTCILRSYENDGTRDETIPISSDRKRNKFSKYRSSGSITAIAVYRE